MEGNQFTMFLRAIEEKDIISIIKKCKNKTSTDCYDIDMKTVNRVIVGISKPLTYIFNLSFRTGQFPNKMKLAKITPLSKTGDHHHFTNDRPISLLSQFSKKKNEKNSLTID